MKHRLVPHRNGAQGLLIRHAKRDPIPPGESVWLAQLTPEGREDAEAYGETLRGFPLGNVYSSPIPRCQETARLMLKGWGHPDATVIEDRFLLSAYVRDRDIARETYRTEDPFQIILDQIADRSINGFHSLEAGSYRLLEAVTSRMTPGALSLFLTHDALLMPFRAYFLKDTYSRDSWLPFLGNASIHVNDGHTFIDEELIPL